VSDYKISKSGRKHIKFLTENNLLISPEEIFKFESLEFLMNFNENNRNIDFSKLINNEAKNFEKWLIEHF